MFIYDLLAKIHFSEFLFFADDLNIFRVIKSAEDCILLQTDIDSIQKWCTENYHIQNKWFLLLVKLAVSIFITFWAIYLSYELIV
jgi:hypothetical protein